jgi:hypothetical protein
MKIASSNIFLSSSHQLQQASLRKESLRTWSSPEQAQTDHPNSPPPAVTNEHGNSPPASQQAKAVSKTDNEDDDSLDATLLLLKRIIEKLFGRRVDFTSVAKMMADVSSSCSTDTPAQAASQPQPTSGAGAEYRLDTASAEFEQMQFAAGGVVKTADGQEINFSLALQMQRQTLQEEHLAVTIGDAPQTQIDPLVLNFDGSAAQLRSGTFKFDLQADGTSEDLPLLGRATAFLALDKNQDGKINDGSELFGPATGQGFAELSKYDSDSNGWIDENDQVYSQLRLWRPDADGKGSLSTLADQQVGAICLQSVATPFTYKTESGESQGAASATGVYLNEDGTPGTIQEINYLV